LKRKKRFEADGTEYSYEDSSPEIEEAMDPEGDTEP
jgi:hypothetical protein